MDSALWVTIEKYDLDDPISEYGFSTRLQNENFWTSNFTKEAILEYKKFMYLAASTDFMISPSEIIDVVWHQHLIFSTSYDQFCALLGKKIEHIPSTHNDADFERFKLAKERTKKAYLNFFGEQPSSIWAYTDIYQPLQLPKYKLRTSGFIYRLFLILLTVIISCYGLLKLYPLIDNPYFIIGYLFLLAAGFFSLERYNRHRLVVLLNSWPKDVFIFNLSPSELVYAEHQQLSHIVHGVISNLILKESIQILPDQKLSSTENHKVENVQEFSSLQALRKSGPSNYEQLLNSLILKPGFNTTARAIKGFDKYLRKSAFFVRLNNENLLVLFTLFFLGLVRVYTGSMNEKPIVLLVIVLSAYLVFIIYYLRRLRTLFSTKILPKFYENQLRASPDDNHQWDYFLLGTAALVPFLIPIVERRRESGADTGSDGGGSGSSDGNSCGSSCGSCGGCGGD